ncbi:MAG: hypothetical protein K2W92_02745 [Alphaproteobacteria bacterium]|nr:hypothetical protein [Alphaproteobacteria bacterium]
MKDKKELMNNYNLDFIQNMSEEQKKYLSKISLVETLTEETKQLLFEIIESGAIKNPSDVAILPDGKINIYMDEFHAPGTLESLTDSEAYNQIFEGRRPRWITRNQNK